MKLRVLSWLKLTVKAVVSALLFVCMGIGIILLMQPHWHTNNLASELIDISQRSLATVTIVGGILLIIWLGLLWQFYERTKLAELILAVNKLVPQVGDTKSEGLEVKRWGHRLQPLAENINGVFEAAQQAMMEEHEIERSKDEMVTNVSHDLRTPLTSILGYLGLIINDNGQQKLRREEIMKYAQTAFDKSGQMKSLVEDLFDYTQVHQVDFKLHWAPLDLAAMLQQLAVNYELEAQQKGVVISAVSNPAVIEMVGDPDRLARVFMNLINNALKYGEGATFVRLSAKAVAEENQVEIRVTNNGAKIPDESIKRLFDRFYRVESSRNTKTGGTGLGLAIVNGVINAHGGQVRVESDDKLTSFIINLPITPEDDEIPN
ncbi:sensor histidine kinase [Weissella paramesenteroides]|uniref:sensor histidine kinase n=1 Tax=Weissella paramesenteroides TaxID=1249 RepID=UPI003F745327